eukprot:TRINITY_DN60054_c0_g1_i1.p1 TRINITY_DN60054_c0_g1~~TRINITY_DN60054_c0_g1_i1.p1  ORF type:complete len:368 (-),score=91.90 TRINITY_DN60054_c0_g1_i1:196-1266(-)
MEESESDHAQDSYAQHYGVCNNINGHHVFDNIWFFYLIFLAIITFLPSLVYAVFIKCCHPVRFCAVKWHVIIFIINCSLWYVLTVTIFAGLCRLPISHGFYVIALPFIFVLFILTILDIFLSPEGKYFLSFQRVYSTSEYLEMVRAALPSIKVNVKSLYKEPMQKNLKQNRPTKKMIMTAHRYFSIDSFLDESSLPGMEGEGNNHVTTFHIKKVVLPGDDFSDKQFLTFKTKFISSCQRNRGGHFLEDTVEMDIPGLEDRVVTVSNSEALLPWWARRKLFYVLSALSASILLRILFQTRSRRHNMVVTKKYFVYPLNRGGGEEPDPGRGHAGYEEYQPFLAEEDGPPPYNPTIEWK